MRSNAPQPIAARLAVLAAGVVAATLLATPPAQAQTTADEGVPPGTGSSDTATDTEISDALSEAATTGEEVEIESLASSDSEVYATPEGTFVEEIALEPYQAESAEGTWAPIDNTLIASATGTLVPTNSDSGLELSGGGDTTIARVTDVHGRSVAYTWHESLPAPAVTGDTATYAEVLPGVDLKIKATNEGFAKVFEVKTPEAAASADVASLEMGLELDGFTAAIGDTGALEIFDFAGNVVYGGPTPVMWDATPPDETVGDSVSVDWSPSTFAMTADVATAYTDGVLTLTPDAGMLASPDAVYPLRIDPKHVKIGRSAWGMVSDWSGYRNRSYYNGGSFEKDSNGTARVGRAYDYRVGMEQTWRLAFEFNTSKFRGKDIIEADLRLTLTYSWMHQCDGISTTADIHELDAGNLRNWTWNRQGDWGSKIASRDEGIASGCGAPRQLWTDVTSYVDEVAGTSDRKIQFGLKASSETCGTHCTGFRRFGPEKTKDDYGGVYLRVKYNTAPNKPGSFTIDGQSCRSGSTVKLGAAVSWTVTAKLADAEGDNMDGVLKWTDQDSGSTKTWNTSGTDRERATWSVHAGDLGGQTYKATVAAKDSRATGASAGGCTVLVDTIPPDPPTVTSTDYPADGNTHGSVGKTGRFTLQSASDDTAGYHWSLQDAPGDNTVPVSTLGSGATIAFDPPTSGVLTLSAWAYDEHGNTSTKTSYTFTVGDASDPIAHWKLDETDGTTAADWPYEGNEDDVDLPLTVTGGQWTGGTAADAANDHLNYLTFDGAGEATTDSPPIDTDVSYTVSAWVRVHETDVDYTIASQDGIVNSAFMLKYDGESHEFLFVTCNRDSNQPESGLACPSAGSEVSVQAGVWYHVTGVYDYGNGQMRIYVNGQLQNTAPISGVFDANGSFVLGRDLYGGNEGTRFAGDVDDVKVWDRIVSTGEIGRLGQHAEGIWDFESVDTDNFPDLSGGSHELNGTDVELVEGIDGMAAGFNGSTSTATTYGQVLDTSGDFTIGAWVRLDSDDETVNVLSQDGAYVSPFYLGYVSNHDRWAFRTTTQDSTSYGWKELHVPMDVAVGEWTHLAVVYEAAEGEVAVYVNGNPAAQTTGFDLWSASGPLRVGSVLHRGVVTDYWPGAIDNANVSTGAFDDQQVKALADITVRTTNSELLTGHFNHDDHLDAIAIVESDERNSDIYFLEGDGTGGFVRSTDPVFESDDLNLLEERRWHLDDAVWRVGDVNGDGRDDLVLAVAGDEHFEVWALPSCARSDRLCKKDGYLFSPTDIVPLELSETAGWTLSEAELQVEDVTGDQHADLVMLRRDGLDTYSVWASEFGETGLETPVQLATDTGDTHGIELAVADFDGDWWGDVAEIRTDANGNAAVYIRHGSATGLGTPVLALAGAGNWDADRDHVTIADVTGDGLPDFVNAYRFTSRVRIQVAAALPDRGGFTNTAWDYSSRCTGCSSDLTPWVHTRLVGGDVNADGTDDLFTLRAGVDGDVGAMWTRISTGTMFAAPQPTWADATTCFGVEGDVNGDGYRDAVLPYPTYDASGITDAGAIWFVDGATGAASIVHQNTASVEGDSEASDQFGFSVGMHDADADGCSEIVAGVPGENESTGYVQVLPGAPQGIDTAADYLMSQGSHGVPGANEAGDQFGHAVTATNLPDGTPVLAIGIPGEDVQTDATGAYRDGDTRVSEVENGGAIVYIQGDGKAWVDQNTFGSTKSVEAGDQFGWSLSATSTLLVVGIPFEDGVGTSDEGGILLLDHTTSSEGRPDYIAWLDQGDEVVPGGSESGDRLGYSVAAIDYWPQGAGANEVHTRVVAAAPWEDLSSNTIADAGTVSMLNLDDSGALTLAASYRQGAELGDGLERSDHLGTSLAFADLDPTRQATNATLKLIIGAQDEDGPTSGDFDLGIVHITGAAAPSAGIDTIIKDPAAAPYCDFGAGLGHTAHQFYVTAPGTDGLYAVPWSDALEGMTETAAAVTA
ncbi:LamG domain-containing protein [Glycomyces tarimensis]